jgi:hypothetical protein
MVERARIDPIARANMLARDAGLPKERFRVQAGSSSPSPRRMVGDSFQNFQAALGLQANNLSNGATYGFIPQPRAARMDVSR